MLGTEFGPAAADALPAGRSTVTGASSPLIAAVGQWLLPIGITAGLLFGLVGVGADERLRTWWRRR